MPPRGMDGWNEFGHIAPRKPATDMRFRRDANILNEQPGQRAADDHRATVRLVYTMNDMEAAARQRTDGPRKA